MKIETVNTGKGPIEYSSTGQGKPVLFLHGGHSNCRETLFHKGFDTRSYRLINPSRPGYGNTPLNGNTTPRKTADLMVALLDYLGVEKTVVYGISAGGLTAIEIAGIYPERVEKLVLASAVSKKWLDKNGKVYNMAKKMFNPKTGKMVWGMVRFFSRIFPGMIARNFHPQFSTNNLHKLEKEDVKELLAAFMHYGSKSGFMADIDHNIDDNVLSKIECPTLVIHSRNDNSVSFEHAEHAHRQIKNSKLEGLDNEWGHLFWIGKDSDESIKKILAFIEGV